jgi:hypothetical protein
MKEESLLFVNKKKQKNFIHLPMAGARANRANRRLSEHHARTQTDKVFLLLFVHKKKAFLLAA